MTSKEQSAKQRVYVPTGGQVPKDLNYVKERENRVNNSKDNVVDGLRGNDTYDVRVAKEEPIDEFTPLLNRKA